MTPLDPRSQGLGFVGFEEWNQDTMNDEEMYVRYRVVWKVMIGKRIESTITEEDIALEPISYGPRILLPRLAELLKRKVEPPKTIQAVETDVVLNVTDRSEENFVTQYARTNANWREMQDRLLK